MRLMIGDDLRHSQVSKDEDEPLMALVEEWKAAMAAKGGSEMELPRSLVAAIESTHVAFEGLSYPLRLVSVEPDPPPPLERTGAKLTVETVHAGTGRQVVTRLSAEQLKDEAHVVEVLATAMRNLLTDGR